MDLFKLNLAEPKAIKFDNWMDIKKDSFGGPKEIVSYTKDSNKGWARRVVRNKDFENGVLNSNSDSMWLAMDKDQISRTEGAKTELSEHGEKYYREGKAQTSINDFLKQIKKESI